MPEPFQYIPRDRLKGFASRCSELFQTPVFLLDSGGRPLGWLEGEAPPSRGLLKRPVVFRAALMGHVALSSRSRLAAARLDFMERGLLDMLHAGYEAESLSAEVVRNYGELSTLWGLSSRLGGAGLDVDMICGVLAEEVMNICPSNNLSVLLLTDGVREEAKVPCLQRGHSESPRAETPLLFPKVSLGADSSRASLMALNPKSGLFRAAFDGRGPITVCDVSSDERFDPLPYHLSRILIVPLLVEGQPIGAVLASDKLDGEEFFTTEIKLIESIASECAVSIKKALLFNEVHTMLFGMVESLSSALDAKHPYTSGHSKRVAGISANIAKRMGLPGETIQWLRLAALLHDVGKIGTPEIILDKESSLDAGEMDRVMEHPIVGSRMIGHVRRMREIAQWICHHHEKFDGSGYPSGLKGEEIPLPSRIIAVADYFDALISDRAYRKAYERDRAIEIMQQYIGTHFDPTVFEHFRHGALQMM